MLTFCTLGDRVRILKGHLGWVLGCDWCTNISSDLVLTTSSDTTVRLWRPSNGQLLALLEHHTHHVTRGRFSTDGSRIVTSSSDRSVVVWNVATFQPAYVLLGHTMRVNDVRWSSDSKLIVSASDDKTSIVWDASTGQAKSVLRGHATEVTGEYLHWC